MATCSLCKNGGLTLRTDIRDLCPSCQKLRNDEIARKMDDLNKQIAMLQSFHAKWSVIPNVEAEVNRLRKAAENDLENERLALIKEIDKEKEEAQSEINEIKMQVTHELSKLKQIQQNSDLAVATAQQQIASLFLSASKDFKEIARARAIKCSPKSDYVKMTPSTFAKAAQYSFVAFDLETTGLSAYRDEIIEIGAIKYIDGQEVDNFVSFVRPQKDIPPNITVLTGINNRMVEEAPMISEILPSFLSFVGESPLIAHNASFDIGFLQYAIERCGSMASIRYADSLEMARKKFRGLEDYKLGTIAWHLGSSTDGLHRALADCKVVCDIVLADKDDPDL